MAAVPGVIPTLAQLALSAQTIEYWSKDLLRLVENIILVFKKMEATKHPLRRTLVANLLMHTSLNFKTNVILLFSPL